MDLLIKNYVFILCYIISFKKILNIRKTGSVFRLLLPILPFSLIYSLIDYLYPYISYMILILCFSLFQTYMERLSFEISFITSLIAYAITYLLFAISAFIVSFVVALIPATDFNIFSGNLWVYQCILAVIELSLTLLIWQTKRLKNGLPFINNKKYTFLGVCISLCIVVLSSILNDGKADTYYFVLFLFVYIFTIMLIIYSRNSVTSTYMDELTKRTIQDLNYQLLTKNNQYNELFKDKERLSEIVHRDNKLIPALETAVTTYLKENADIEQGQALLAEIERLSKERVTTIELIEQKLNSIPLCHITAIDNLLSYMQQKAKQSEIQFDVNYHCDLNTVIEETIDINDLCTLLADLIENAIIATMHNKGNCIMLNFSIIKDSFTIQITDSGIPFEKEVLLKMGLEKITTHGDEKGTGIGMMKTFEILKQYHASLLIDEYDSSIGLYAKTISVICDDKNQFILYTLRDELEIAELYNRSDIIVIHK